jgi:hypothetical protein
MSHAALFDPTAYWIGMCTKIKSMERELGSIVKNTALPAVLRQQSNTTQIELLALERLVQNELAGLKDRQEERQTTFPLEPPTFISQSTAPRTIL